MAPPLRICIDARLGSGEFGGVEQFVIGLAAGLSGLENSDEEYLFLTYPEHEEWIRPYLGGRCSVLHTRRNSANRFARRVVRGVLNRASGVNPRFAVLSSDGTVERNRIDVVHFPFQDAFLTSVPSIYQPHDLQHRHLPDLFTETQIRRRERVYRTHSARAALVVSMTSWGRRDLLEQYGFEEGKVAVVPGGSVLWEYPTPSAEDLARLRSRLGLPDGFLLYPAQTWPHKNHLRLLEAVAAVRDREGVIVPLVCSGRHTGHFTEVEAKVRELGLEQATWFPGFVSPLELRGLYELATGLVFPSRFEGWGLPICEAWSAGLPIASSSATGLPGLVDGAGLLFSPDDTDEIANSILRLWTDEGLRAELAEAGRRRGELFTFDRTARLFRAHYRRLGGRPLSEEDRILLATPSLA
jgi:glycosyltransferase involved in cell wall biosynthesis